MRKRYDQFHKPFFTRVYGASLEYFVKIVKDLQEILNSFRSGSSEQFLSLLANMRLGLEKFKYFPQTTEVFDEYFVEINSIVDLGEKTEVQKLYSSALTDLTRAFNSKLGTIRMMVI